MHKNAIIIVWGVKNCALFTKNMALFEKKICAPFCALFGQIRCALEFKTFSHSVLFILWNLWNPYVTKKKIILQSTTLPWWQICFQNCPGRCLSSVGRSVLARFKSIWKPFHVESSIVFNLLPYKKVTERQKKVPGNLSYCASRSITIRRVNKRGHKCASFGKANEMKAIKRSSKWRTLK